MTYAVEAEKAVENLITELARAGSDAPTTQALQGVAETLRNVVKALGAGQYATGDQAPPATIDQGIEGLQSDMQGAPPGPPVGPGAAPAY